MARFTRTDRPPDGLAYFEEIITPAEEASTIAAIEALELQPPVMRGYAAKRVVTHFGFDYGYDNWKVTQTEPMPPFIDRLRLRAAERAGLEADLFVQVLIAKYPPGAAIGWHRDAPPFGPDVLGISLGSFSTMRFRQKNADGTFTHFHLPLAPRSLYRIGGQARTLWQHSLAPATEPRYSVTFRSLRAGAKQVGASTNVAVAES